MSDKDETDQTNEDAVPTPEEIAKALQPGNDNKPDLNEDDIYAAKDATGAAEGDLEPDPLIVLERLQAENTELNDRLLRAAAEAQNIRRRAEREKQEAGQYAVTSFAKDIISVADNLTRALEAIPPEAREGLNEVLKNLIAGVEMTERELLNVFRRHGIIRLDPLGEKFDPNLHEAMFETENPDVPAGTVMSVAQCGYRIANRVLRPAMVGISNGGPKTATTKDATASQKVKAEPNEG